MTTPLRIAVGSCTLAAVLVASAAGCGTSIDAARDTTAAEACDFSERCGSIGAGKEFSTRDDCLAKRRAGLVDLWPTAECDGSVSSDALDTCNAAIRATQCNNPLDILNTLVSKCGKAQVCAGS